jgi:hypothetical protein
VRALDTHKDALSVLDNLGRCLAVSEFTGDDAGTADTALPRLATSGGITSRGPETSCRVSDLSRR